ncbi:response regulator [Tichowtungia aerotolerans]|uniref:Response regulator n=1 Tax=Tichowtungia aerotolerans TaxID=2697043 RepID=A0A6P1MDI8_9BACT|nr:response regulator [Tichowtungia aerotolerans]QHI69656.1 response regulator [Tichowtungia aerotolerans]
MKNLLIVDDDPHLLESLAIVFSGIYQVFSALSAEDAVRIVRNEKMDVVLLDVVLPGMDGIEFLSVLRSEAPDLPVVMISGSPSVQPVLKALELGARDYVRKPFDIAELRLVVGRALKNASLERRVKELEEKLSVSPVVDLQKPLKKAVEEYEKKLIQRALRRTGGVQTRAAEELGTTRRILRYRIEKLQIKS